MNNTPLIIGGFFRTGTSLLRRMLDSHSNIHCGPEVKFFRDFYNDYVKDELRHVRFFNTLRTTGLIDDELLDIFGKAFVQSHKLAAFKKNKIRWADKNPENVLYLSEWQKLLPDGFVFIHVVRHPMDTLASLKEVGFLKTVPAEFENKVKLFKFFYEKGKTYTDKHPENSITIHYEDLVNSPKETLGYLLSKINEVFEPAMLLNFNSSDRGKGIEDPKIKKTKSIHNTSIGRWKIDLSNDEIKCVKNILAKEMFIYR